MEIRFGIGRNFLHQHHCVVQTILSLTSTTIHSAGIANNVLVFFIYTQYANKIRMMRLVYQLYLYDLIELLVKYPNKKH